jgi:hypothetical protein
VCASTLSGRCDDGFNSKTISSSLTRRAATKDFLTIWAPSQGSLSRLPLYLEYRASSGSRQAVECAGIHRKTADLTQNSLHSDAHDGASQLRKEHVKVDGISHQVKSPIGLSTTEHTHWEATCASTLNTVPTAEIVERAAAQDEGRTARPYQPAYGDLASS